MNNLLDQFISDVGEDRYKLNESHNNYQDLIDRIAARETVSYFLDDKMQCNKGPRRSLIDIARIALYHFPETPIEEIVKYVAQSLQSGKFRSFYCPDIKRQVVMRSSGNSGGFAEGDQYPTTLGFNSPARQLLQHYYDA